MSCRRVASFVCAVAIGSLSASVLATPITIGSPFLMLYHVGINSLGFTAGERIRFGANSVLPNGDNGTTAFATTTNTSTLNLVTRTVNPSPSPVSPNFFSRTIPYDTNLTGPWTLHFANGTDVAERTLSLPAAAQQTPFVNSITLTGTALNPTFSWTPPPGAHVDGYRVNIYDKSLVNSDPTTGPVNSGNIVSLDFAPTTTSYTVKKEDFDIPGYEFQIGKLYSIEISLLQTRDGTGNTSNANIYAMSRVYADFKPLPGTRPAVNLPVVNIDGAYQYNITIRAGVTYYLDPEIAVGYDFQIGAGDPNFASVLFPDLGDFDYSLYLWDGSGWKFDALVAPDTPFLFDAGGVDRFRVTGIDESLMLDPLDSTAFITGVTFTGAGTFTGTQTPIIVAVTVPEPASLALLAFGLAALGFTRRRSA